MDDKVACMGSDVMQVAQSLSNINTHLMSGDTAFP